MLKIVDLNLKPYDSVWQEMKAFTAQRDEATGDEIWLLQHPPVYTQGQAGKAEHLLNPTSIPVVQSDRGGQITYHGPGQLVVYFLFDLKRRQVGIRTFVTQLEECLLLLLSSYAISGSRHCGAPGIYIQDEKIASIGLRVKNGYTYHGIALNINMDLTPFLNINPCGFHALRMTQLSHYYPTITLNEVSMRLSDIFLTQFSQK